MFTCILLYYIIDCFVFLGVLLKLLLIEDDVMLGEAVVSYLEAHQNQVDWVQDGAIAMHAAESQNYDCIILDINLPHKNGFEILRAMRAKKVSTPVLILSVRDGLEDKLKGLDQGADDYLTKPFALQELVARIQALYRRKYSDGIARLSHGDITFDLSQMQVYKQEQPISLQQRELALLKVLLAKRGQVLSSEFLADQLYDFDDVMSNSIQVHIYQLRKKLGKDLIHTRRGLGYCIMPAKDAS